MRNILILFLLLNGSALRAEDDLLKVRSLYYQAATDKTVSERFYTCLKGNPKIPASLLNGYTGMSYMIKANYSWNPYNKLIFFNKGKDYLNTAIARDPKNTELRFLRFCVQTNAPGFLCYSDEIPGDKAFILASYALLNDADLKSRIRDYMKSSNYCTEQEKSFLNERATDIGR